MCPYYLLIIRDLSKNTELNLLRYATFKVLPGPEPWEPETVLDSRSVIRRALGVRARSLFPCPRVAAGRDSSSLERR